MSFSQPLCQIDKRAAPAGCTRRTALTPRVTFLKSHRDIIAFGCYRTRWDSHINLRMKTYHFSSLETITKNVELRRGCVSSRRHSARSFRSRKETVPPVGMWYVVGGMWGGAGSTYHLRHTIYLLCFHQHSRARRITTFVFYDIPASPPLFHSGPLFS